jgi:hypothetical protein
MSRQKPRMTPLESRKRLLIAESELNRAQLVQDWRTMEGEARSLARKARTIGTVASSVASLASGLMSFRSKKSEPSAEKPSWWRVFLNGAQLVGSFLSQFHT